MERLAQPRVTQPPLTKLRLADLHFMPPHLAALLLAALAFLTPLAHTQQPTQALFLDHSGSMKPYYASGLVQSIAAPLNRTPLSLYAFSTSVSPASSLGDIESLPFGNYTFLDKVVDTCRQRHLPIAWIVTDNIEDTGEVGDTERFYARLRGDEVLRVTVFPILAHPGQPGLLVYALLFDPALNPQYDQALAAFTEHGTAILRTEPLRMKPVNRDTIEVTSRSLTPLTRRGRSKVYDTGVPIRESVEVRFKSRFDHIQLVDSTLRIVQASPAFQPGSLLVPERRDIRVTPDRIAELGPGAETTQAYLLSVDLGQVRLKNTPAALWKAAWGKPEEEGQLDLSFQIDVPQQNFRLTPQFLTHYSAATVEQARATGKVYAIDRLMSQVNAGNTAIQVSAPVYFRVRYPTWPAILWFLLLALAAAIALALILLSRKLLAARTRNWQVTASAAAGYPLEARIDGDRVLVEGEPLARIERNHLLPLGSVRLAGGQTRIPIAVGIPIPAKSRGLDLQLIFTESSNQPASIPSTSNTAASTATIRRR